MSFRASAIGSAQRSIPPKSLAEIVDSYIRDRRTKAAKELKFYREQISLSDAISIAARCQTRHGKHRHQWRLKAETLNQAASTLGNGLNQIRSCSSFEALMRTIEGKIGSIKGIGELTKYDIAHRIGAYLGLFPKKVYLHAGTRDGARVLGFDGKLTEIDIRDLPRELRRLRPHEIEDCLCVYKRELWKLANGEFPKRAIKTRRTVRC